LGGGDHAKGDHASSPLPSAHSFLWLAPPPVCHTPRKLPPESRAWTRTIAALGTKWASDAPESAAGANSTRNRNHKDVFPNGLLLTGPERRGPAVFTGFLDRDYKRSHPDHKSFWRRMHNGSRRMQGRLSRLLGDAFKVQQSLRVRQAQPLSVRWLKSQPV
jgi:hypothetical protein